MYKSYIAKSYRDGYSMKVDFQVKDTEYSININNLTGKLYINAVANNRSTDREKFKSIEDYFASSNRCLITSKEAKMAVFNALVDNGRALSRDNATQIKLTYDIQDEAKYSINVCESIDNLYFAEYLYEVGLVHLVSFKDFTEYLGNFDEISRYLEVETGISKDQVITGVSEDDIEKYKDVQSDSVITTEVEEYTDIDFTDDVKEHKGLQVSDIQWPSGLELKNIIKLLSFKKSILLQGPPGTGKTKMAEAIGREFLGNQYDASHFVEIQFSAEYSYSDFMDGLRPDEDGQWKLEDGTFMKLCKLANSNPDEKFILFIDEINRANTEQVIGEMLNLMEKRDYPIITKNGSSLTMPNNLYVIATMNTIDRGAGELDMATISRFAEIDIVPAKVKVNDILKSNKNIENLDDDKYNELKSKLNSVIDLIEDINNKIANDKDAVDINTSGLQIGFRCLYSGINDVDDLKLAVRYDLRPEIMSRANKLGDETFDNVRKLVDQWLNGQEAREESSEEVTESNKVEEITDEQ